MVEDKRALSQQRFGGFAQRYVNSAVHAGGYTLERLVALVAPGPGKWALDIATGGGHVALAMARAGATVIASDLTQPMLRAARAHLTEQLAGQGATAYFAGVESGNFPFANASLDIVTCRLAAHHFPDVARFVREAARVVKPGGIVGVVDQIGPGEPQADRYCNAFERLRDPSHAWQYNQADWETFFYAENLDVQVSEVAAIPLDFEWWTQQQDNTPETVVRLRVLLRQAPHAVAEWFEPNIPETAGGSFTHRHLIIAGVKR